MFTSEYEVNIICCETEQEVDVEAPRGTVTLIDVPCGICGHTVGVEMDTRDYN